MATDGFNLSNVATVTVQVKPAPKTYTSTEAPKAIADLRVTTSTIVISDSYTIADVNVRLDISHGRISDLRVFLIGPSGFKVELFSNIGGNGKSFTNTVLDDEATTSITSGRAPYTGTFRPVGDLSLYEGTNFQGTWTLEIYDTF